MNSEKRRQQIERFLAALDQEQIEVGIFNPVSKLLMLRGPLPACEFENYRKWLAHENAKKGEGIFIRPAAAEFGNLVLVDDLTEPNIVKIRSLLLPAAIVETSPNNYQAWIKFDSPADQNFRTRIAKYLAQKLQADPGAASWRQFGRCPGFNNTKPEHRKPNGFFPVAKLTFTSAIVHPLPGLTQAQKKPIRPAQRQVVNDVRRADEGLDLSSLDYTSKYEDFTQHLQTEDRSERDFGVACEALKFGLAVAQVRELLWQSPSLANRKKDPNCYLDLTLEAAYNSVVFDQGFDLPTAPPKPARKSHRSPFQSGLSQGEE